MPMASVGHTPAQVPHPQHNPSATTLLIVGMLAVYLFSFDEKKPAKTADMERAKTSN
jgi:hypothetical protein